MRQAPPWVDTRRFGFRLDKIIRGRGREEVRKVPNCMSCAHAPSYEPHGSQVPVSRPDWTVGRTLHYSEPNSRTSPILRFPSAVRDLRLNSETNDKDRLGGSYPSQNKNCNPAMYRTMDPTLAVTDLSWPPENVWAIWQVDKGRSQIELSGLLGRYKACSPAARGPNYFFFYHPTFRFHDVPAPQGGRSQNVESETNAHRSSIIKVARVLIDSSITEINGSPVIARLLPPPRHDADEEFSTGMTNNTKNFIVLASLAYTQLAEQEFMSVCLSLMEKPDLLQETEIETATWAAVQFLLSLGRPTTTIFACHPRAISLSVRPVEPFSLLPPHQNMISTPQQNAEAQQVGFGALFSFRFHCARNNHGPYF
ncbi:hypothetical protein RRG08_043954 [Elysia crispata]|uniref:Uncharacterized protein n=1 Tax=Elysia crispata TaxID=231223 RepID=A0AAE0Y1B0_9GAST|nr:hypothetical protein RRG08_043954 [Elysia crispata]